MMKIAANLQCLAKLNLRLSTNIRFNSQLFVSRLSFYTTDDEFRQLFTPFGAVKCAKLIMDSQTGRPKGFGFVTFENEAEAQNALKALNGRIVQGRIIFVEFANETKD
ncbi:hypothetical protein RND81_08G188100 [Saponaria officinalis]|uniref:RRM domain-containing protein n=1 Tax=Saponaria officinalis TaxID=3572 RepID=A0AAW1J8I9_SAPOF